MNQQEFYQLPEVQEQIQIQKMNPYGSDDHKAAFDAISEVAKKVGVWEQYKKAGGDVYD